MRILGLDPGFGITGWGFVSFRGSSLNQPTLHSYGALTTPGGRPLSLRLADLQNQFIELLDRLEPDRVAMERLFFGKNITTAEGVYQARGVLLAAMGQKGIVPIELTPNQIKQSITGSGKARKPEMMRMVQMLLNIDEPIRPDDAADALGCAIVASAFSHLEYEQLQQTQSKHDSGEDSPTSELQGEVDMGTGIGFEADAEYLRSKTSPGPARSPSGEAPDEVMDASALLEGEIPGQLGAGSEIRFLRHGKGKATASKGAKSAKKEPRPKATSPGKAPRKDLKSAGKAGMKDRATGRKKSDGEGED
ncbi:MAG: hypothetical protein CMN76_09165 [Spirochaetaceae bacterium]|nr:hypothetical protein [Spirochaetaceae bacterium]